ncbi:hypothetical protein HK100_005091 [Physocladia obscura]|uniref:DUF155 domain-containing protein n=1 Tax=Physocladia obscura TaxID=109957 RepID=A0AAD5SS42_9FUNG|nr:hypothetical protein HK100_005091 [Physocladia obscura]
MDPLKSPPVGSRRLHSNNNSTNNNSNMINNGNINANGGYGINPTALVFGGISALAGSIPVVIPQRTTKTASKLVVFPPASPPITPVPPFASGSSLNVNSGFDAIPASDELFGGTTSNINPTHHGPRTEAEALPKEFRSLLPRVTCYCAADSYDLTRIASFLRLKHGVIARRIDECLYVSYEHAATAPSSALIFRHSAKRIDLQNAVSVLPNSNVDIANHNITSLDTFATSAPSTSSPLHPINIIPGHTAPIEIPVSETIPASLLMPGMFVNFPETHLTDPHLASPPIVPIDDQILTSVENRDSLPTSTMNISKFPEDGNSPTNIIEGVRRRVSSRPGGSTSNLIKLNHSSSSEHVKEQITPALGSVQSTIFQHPFKSQGPTDFRWMGRNEVFLFDFGVIVLWNFTVEEENLYLSILKPFATNPRSASDAEVEDFHFQYDFNKPNQPRIYNDMITLKSGNPMIKLTISHGISQSAKLARFEHIMEEEITRTTLLPKMMAKYGEVKLTHDDVMKVVGRLFRLRMDVNLVSNVLDTPEIFWSEPELQGLYNAIRTYLEISQRVKLLNKRTGVISDLLDMLSDHLHGSQMTMMTGIVIVLIVITCIVAGGEVYVKILLEKKGK